MQTERVTITEIRKTRQGRFALFCENGFLFSLDSETFFTRSIGEGMALAPAELEELRAASETRKAADKALQYLSLRDYASGELYQKLCTRFDEPSAAAAVAKAADLGLLNDEQFARHRARYLLERHKSRREIARHLAQKGIDRETAEAVLEELFQPAQPDGPGPEAAAALALLRKSYARRLAEGRRDAVLAALARRGFSYAAVREALEWYGEEQAEAEE